MLSSLSFLAAVRFRFLPSTSSRMEKIECWKRKLKSRKEEEKKIPITTTLTAEEETHYAPWLDLQDPLTELILERLPLRYYLRFGAVCRKWLSIQRAHRHRHAPGPPPMPETLPWLIPCLLDQELPFYCCSPFDLESKVHILELPDLDNHSLIISQHGWLLLSDDKDYLLLLLNPVSRAQIPLPPLQGRHGRSCTDLPGALSASPSQPDCMILMANDDEALCLCKLNSPNKEWTVLPSFEGNQPFEHIGSVVYYGGKFYCISTRFRLFVVDPLLSTPTLHILEMDGSQVPLDPNAYSRFFLVESKGEVFVVMALFKRHGTLKKFQVFRADLSSNSWVRVKRLDDCAVFLDSCYSFTQTGSDSGCKKNRIYYPLSLFGSQDDPDLYEQGKVFGVFDLGKDKMINQLPIPALATEDLLALDYDRYYLHWVVPRLDYPNPNTYTGLFQG